MTTYNTYQGAKIAMPKACICVYKNDGKDVFIGMPSREGTTLFNGAEFAEPQDYCMTVEKFLAGGYKFVEGDLIINTFGNVNKIRDDEELRNELVAENNNSRYILRAATLENIPTETPEEKEVMDSIESVGEVEWKNGDECVYRHQPDVTYMFVGIHPVNKKSAICWNEKEGIAQIHIDFISKPETQKKREYRERLENGKAIYDLMCSIELNHDIAGAPNTWGELRDEWQSVYIKLAEEVGYRKEKTNGTN
ncbi:hypothetical protein NVP1243O_70 [Vibrio phage 1.243.O._10N.261.54.B5]|nr:hypothetical protein NVP1243O_70 [Vibrio phage 1.243.O._10N.261.54.B5]